MNDSSRPLPFPDRRRKPVPVPVRISRWPLWVVVLWEMAGLATVLLSAGALTVFGYLVLKTIRIVHGGH